MLIRPLILGLDADEIHCSCHYAQVPGKVYHCTTVLQANTLITGRHKYGKGGLHEQIIHSIEFIAVDGPSVGVGNEDDERH